MAHVISDECTMCGVKKTVTAAQKVSAQSVILGGGVAANSYLREQLQIRCEQLKLQLLISPKKYCTDNAAMVAGLGYHLFRAGRTAELDFAARA